MLQITGKFQSIVGNERNEKPVLDFYEMFAEKRGKPMAIPETGAWYNLCDNPRTNGSMCGNRVRCCLTYSATALPAAGQPGRAHVLLRCCEGLCGALCTALQRMYMRRLHDGAP
jgi:hypothetical protein